MKATLFFESDQVELLEAIQKGNEAKARKILDRGTELNTHGEEGITPLFWLIMQKDDDAVELALELGGNPNLAAPNGDTPITMMAGGNDSDLLRLLLEHGGNPNAKDRNGEPALFGAIGEERWANIKMLLEYGADPNFKDRSNTNSAHYAALLNKFEITHYLIEQGADPRNRDTVDGDIAWTVHEGLSEGLLNPEYQAYEWALKVKEQLKEHGVEFPPPSPSEVRFREGRANESDIKAMEKNNNVRNKD